MKRYFSVLPLLLILVACSEAPKTAQKKEAAPPPEPVTGREAFFKMFGPARAWAPDVQPLELVSINLPEVKAERGKAGAWQATFVSVSKGKKRVWTYSVIEAAGNLHKGVFAGLEGSYSPSGQVEPWLMAALKTDSDEVYKTALTKGAEYDKKNPGKTITFLLQKTKKFPNPAWRVVWGESVGTSNFSVFVDASTGKYLETAR
jgi:hypothetical protein